MLLVKKNYVYSVIFLTLITGCTSQKKLAYLENLPADGSESYFPVDIPEYQIQYRDVLYITIRGMTSDGIITDFLSTSRTSGGNNNTQGEAGQFLFGFDVNINGEISIPVLGNIKVAGLTLDETKSKIQDSANTCFNNSTVECKLLSFKFTVIGEVRSPGTYINYNNYLTVLEAIGRAGGISDYGRRDKLIVLRPVADGTKTFVLNLQDKAILSSKAYFLLPNDVVIVEPESKKIFNLNLPVVSFIITSATSLLTTTLLLINFWK